MSYNPPREGEDRNSQAHESPRAGVINPLLQEPLSPPSTSTASIPVTVQPLAAANEAPRQQQLPSSGYIQSQQSPSVNVLHNWATSLFDCMREEESCWWSFWCCWIISARNTEEFQLGSAKKQISWCIGIFFLSLVLIILKLGPLGPLLLIGSSIYYVYYRTNNRQQMKAQQHIMSGEWMSDCLLHCCCTCCSVAQEARESLVAPRNKRLDYCSSQELSELAPSTDNSLDEMDTIGPSSHFNIASSGAITERFQSIYFKLSHTSQNILIVLGLLSLLLMISLLATNPLSFVVLLLVFIQPLVVLYLIYWRGRRKFAQLDYVVKMFCVGFFLSTTQSVFFENILQQLLTIVGILLFFLFNGSNLPSDDGGASNSGNGDFLWSHPIAGVFEQIYPRRGAFLYQEQYQSFSPHLHPIHRSISHLYTVAMATISSPSSDTELGGEFSGIHSAEYSFDPYETTLSSPSMFPTLAPSNSSQPIDFDNLPRELLRDNILLILFLLFLMAFVVAAGVEETMKHFAVRCCRFPAPLKDPQMILVYLVSAALGFATAENIEYVFGVRQSPIPGTSRFVGELIVLAMRLLMPIHLICAVIQSANLSRVVLGIYPHWPLARVLLSAVVLHGSFDYFLFAIGVIQYTYEIDSIAMDIFSMAFPLVITILGVVYAYRTYSEVEKRFQENWRTIATHDEETGNSML